MYILKPNLSHLRDKYKLKISESEYNRLNAPEKNLYMEDPSDFTRFGPSAPAYENPIFTDILPADSSIKWATANLNNGTLTTEDNSSFNGFGGGDSEGAGASGEF